MVVVVHLGEVVEETFLEKVEHHLLVQSLEDLVEEEEYLLGQPMVEVVA